MTDFRVIPSHERYPGLTALPISDTKELVVMAVGKDAEKALLSCKAK
jgi:hypothetical protein